MNLKENPPKKLLIINIFGIGDVLFTTPIIRSLKTHFPSIEIHYLCNERVEGIIKNNPNVDQVYVYNQGAIVKQANGSKFKLFAQYKKLLNAIKAQQYDTCIDLSLTRLMNIITFLAGIKRKIGFNYKNRSFFLNYKKLLKGYENKHVVDHYCELMEEVGVSIDNKELMLNISANDESWADQFLLENGINPDEKRPVGIFPGGGGSWGKDAKYKRWPRENYAKIADKIIENYGAPIILFGTESERELCEQVASYMQNEAVMACGKTTIEQYAAIAKKCSLVILNDGGPLHIAVAAKAKTLSIFGPVDERVYGPYPVEGHHVVTHDIACRPCYRRFRRASCEHISCLLQLKADQIFREVEKIL